MTANSPDLYSIFMDAMEIDSPVKRAAFLDRSCQRNQELRDQVEKMLRKRETLGDYLESSAFEFEMTSAPDEPEKDHAKSHSTRLPVDMDKLNHSVLNVMGQTVDVPRVILRNPDSEYEEPIVRPNLPEVPLSVNNGRYQLQGEIARGGMGAIIKGRDTDLGRELAIKVLLDEHKYKPEVIQRFVEEAQIGGQLQHPGIAPVYELGQFNNDLPFFTMKLVKGKTLAKLLAARKSHSADRVRFLGIFEQVCQTMAYAHARGVIHRDLKPANIMVGAFGEVQVMDWGLAKVLPSGGIADEKTAQDTQLGKSVIQTLRNNASDVPGSFGSQGSNTQFGSVMGTPAYMPPEQALGEIGNLDERADVFGLGALLCEILTGLPPYVAGEGQEVFRMARRGKLDDCFDRLDASGAESELIALTKQCLEIEPSDRPRDASDLAAQIVEYLESVESKLRDLEIERASQLARLEEERKRRKVNLALATAVLMIVGLATVSWLYLSRQEVKHQTAEALTHKKHAEEMSLLAEQRNEQRAAAEAARTAEAQQRAIAQAAQIEEKNLRERAQQESYAADMKAAQASLNTGNRYQLMKLLERHVPNKGEVDRRGVEWRYLWSASRGDEIYTWRHPNMTPGAMFSPNGLQIATSCFDGHLRVWDVESKALVAQYEHGILDHSLGISFCYSPDGNSLATASTKGLALLDCSTWREKRVISESDTKFSTSELAQTSIKFSPNGRWLAVAKGKIMVWNTETWESFPIPGVSTRRVSFDAESKSLIVCRSGSVIESIDLETRKSSARIRDPDLADPAENQNWQNALVFPNRNWLAMSALRGYVALWDIDLQETIWMDMAHRSRVYGLAISNDGRQFASAGHDQQIHVWDAATQEKLTTLTGHINEIWSVEFSPDDRYLLTSSKDGTVKLWDAQGKPKQNSWYLDAGELPIGFTSNGRGMISISDDGSTLRHWDGPEVVKSLSSDVRLSGARTSFVPESQSLYVLNKDGHVQIRDVNTLNTKRALSLSIPCTRIWHVSPNERWLAGGNPESQLVVWDLASGESIFEFDAVANSNSNTRVVFSPDSRFLAIATRGKRIVQMWDTNQRRFVGEPKAHPWVVYAISFSADGKYMASSSWEGDVRVIESATGREVVPTLHGHGSGVHSHSFSHDGATLVSSGDDYSVRFWNVSTGREMMIFERAYNQGARIPFLSPTDELMVWSDAMQELRVRVEPIPTFDEIEKANLAEMTVAE